MHKAVSHNAISRLAILFLLLVSAGCVQQTGDQAGAVVSTYFQAIVDGDTQHVEQVSCPDWQSTARDEVASFTGVKAHLDGLTCKSVSRQGSESIVECSGTIVATYIDQEQKFDMSGRKIKVIEQQQRWLVCGYN